MAKIDGTRQYYLEYIYGTDEDDIIDGKGGSLDIIDGGNGTDTLFVFDTSENFSLIDLGSFWQLVEHENINYAQGSGAIFQNVEHIQFLDKKLDIKSRDAGSFFVGEYEYQDKPVTGTDSDDLFFGLSRTDYVEGGGGIDTVLFFEPSSNFELIEMDPYLYLKEDVGGITLNGVERLQFRDISLALDIDSSSSAGGIYRTYQAAFNRTPDESGLGYWIDRADNGASAVQMAEEFVWSDEFQQVYGADTNDQYLSGNDIESVVSKFYQNVLGRTPDQGGLDFYTGMIESQEASVGRALAEIADSQENRDNVQAAIQNGIEYDLWLG